MYPIIIIVGNCGSYIIILGNGDLNLASSGELVDGAYLIFTLFYFIVSFDLVEVTYLVYLIRINLITSMQLMLQFSLVFMHTHNLIY